MPATEEIDTVQLGIMKSALCATGNLDHVDAEVNELSQELYAAIVRDHPDAHLYSINRATNVRAKEIPNSQASYYTIISAEKSPLAIERIESRMQQHGREYQGAAWDSGLINEIYAAFKEEGIKMYHLVWT